MYAASCFQDDLCKSPVGEDLLLRRIVSAAEAGSEALISKWIVHMRLLSSAGGRRALGLSKQDKDDPDLVRAVQAGDGWAVSRVLEQCIPWIGRYLARHHGLSSDELEDVLQETRVAFLNAATRFDGRSRLKTYLTQIACRKCIDQIRAKSRGAAQSYELDERCIEADNADPGKSVPDRVSLERALAQLSPRQREVVTMYHFESKSYSDIADELGITVGTVAGTKAEALQRLRKLLTEAGVCSADGAE